MAEAFVATQFPTCLAAIWAGSFVRGDATTTSDLDIVIVLGEGSTIYRENFEHDGFLIETFVHTEASVRRWTLEREVPERRPALARMVVEGRVIVDRLGTAERLQEWCAAVLDAGPAPPTSQEIADARYGITDAVDDILGGLAPGEVAQVAPALAAALGRLELLRGGHWLGSGKWLHRRLAACDAELAERLADATVRAVSGNPADLVALAEARLAPVGGFLRGGYRQEGALD